MVSGDRALRDLSDRTWRSHQQWFFGASCTDSVERAVTRAVGTRCVSGIRVYLGKRGSSNFWNTSIFNSVVTVQPQPSEASHGESHALPASSPRASASVPGDVSSGRSAKEPPGEAEGGRNSRGLKVTTVLLYTY